MVNATFTSFLDFESLDHYYDESSLELRTERSGKAVMSTRIPTTRSCWKAPISPTAETC
jgi:hypothetical protein